MDRRDFLARVTALCEAGAWMVYAWALLPTHFHLLARTAGGSLPGSMRKLLTGYVVNFNRRHKRSGHLFQNRYKSILCEDEPYLLELTRYIHLNPLRAGMLSSLEELIEALRCLPGVGPKSAQRMAYHLMQHNRPGAERLADALGLALAALRHCQRSNTFTQSEICIR